MTDKEFVISKYPKAFSYKERHAGMLGNHRFYTIFESRGDDKNGSTAIGIAFSEEQAWKNAREYIESQNKPIKMTEKEAIAKLAVMIRDITCNCGHMMLHHTAMSISGGCNEIIEAMTKPMDNLPDYPSEKERQEQEKRLAYQGTEKGSWTAFSAGWDAAIRRFVASGDHKPPAIPVDKEHVMALAKGGKIALTALDGNKIQRSEGYGSFFNARTFFSKQLHPTKITMEVALESRKDLSDLIDLLSIANREWEIGK